MSLNVASPEHAKESVFHNRDLMTKISMMMGTNKLPMLSEIFDNFGIIQKDNYAPVSKNFYYGGFHPGLQLKYWLRRAIQDKIYKTSDLGELRPLLKINSLEDKPFASEFKELLRNASRYCESLRNVVDLDLPNKSKVESKPNSKPDSKTVSGDHLLELHKFHLRNFEQDIEESVNKTYTSIRVLRTTISDGNDQTEIAMHGMPLTQGLPDSFYYLTVSKLSIDIDFLPAVHEWNKIGSVTIMDNCGILEKGFPKSFPEKLKSVKKISIPFGRFEILPTLGDSPLLEKLNLEKCYFLKTLPDDFGNLKALEVLQVQYCASLASLPRGFGNLNSLKRLDLTACLELTLLPSDFGKLQSLEKLKLSSCESLRALPEDFGSLTSLTSLDLTYCCSLSTLPDGFGGLRSLRKLHLRDCFSLETSPENFSKLNSLKKLDVRGCESLSVPAAAFENLRLRSVRVIV